MDIAIIALGSRGDVEPYIALGKGLRRAGHPVRLVTHPEFEALVNGHGLEFWPVQVGVQGIAQNAVMRERLGKGNLLAVLSHMAREAERGALVGYQDGLTACRGTDLLIAGIGGLFIGLALGEKLGLPLLQAYYAPFTPTRAYPSFLLPMVRPELSGTLNRLSYTLARQMMWQAFRPADTLARRRVLDLPAASFWGPFNVESTRGLPILYGFSPWVIPRPPDWGDNVHVTGYWFLDAQDGWTPPRVLAEFLRAGPPPVYVGFGSMSSEKPEETAELVVKALALAGQRGILLSGWSGLSKAELPDSVLMVESVPFSWLFPRMAAVVHHGGAGTTAAGLKAGVPSVVVPFFADQPFWGQRVAQLGVGPAPIPRRRLTAERLGMAIQQAVTDQAMRQRAARLSTKIQGEDGVAQAVAVVQKMGKRPAA
jgi:sterol 3beta-glucosyltransferase